MGIVSIFELSSGF